MRYDDPDAPISATIAVISAVVVVVTIVLLQALFYQMQDREFERKVIAPKDLALEKMRAEQHDVLASYGWVDEEAGVTRIPVAQAMEIMVEEGKLGEAR